MTLEKVDTLLEIKKKYEELVPKYEALRKEKEEFNDTAETKFEEYLDNLLNYLEIPIPPTSNNFEDNVKNKTEKFKDTYQKLIDKNKKIKESENNFHQGYLALQEREEERQKKKEEKKEKKRKKAEEHQKKEEELRKKKEELRKKEEELRKKEEELKTKELEKDRKNEENACLSDEKILEFIKIALPNYGKGFVKGMRNSESLEKNGIEFCKYIFKLEREEFEKNFETINFTKEKVNNIVDHVDNNYYIERFLHTLSRLVFQEKIKLLKK